MIQFDDRELKAMEYLAKSRSCKTWLGIFERVIADCVDLRNIEGDNLDVELKARKRAADILDETFVQRIKKLSGTVESDQSDYL